MEKRYYVYRKDGEYSLEVLDLDVSIFQYPYVVGEYDKERSKAGTLLLATGGSGLVLDELVESTNKANKTGGILDLVVLCKRIDAINGFNVEPL